MGKENHIGIVTRNIEKASGVTNFAQTAKVSAQSLSGAVYFKAETLYDGEYPIPAEPAYRYASENGAGDFIVPKVGDTLMIEIDQSIDLPDPKWLYSIYTQERKIHRDFQKNYPNRLGRVTNSGHKFIFDDTEDEESIYLEHSFGSRIRFDEDGSFILDVRKILTRDKKDETKDTFDEDWFNLLLDYTEKLFHMRYQEKDDENFFDKKWDRANAIASEKYQPTDDIELFFESLWDHGNDVASSLYQKTTDEFFKQVWDHAGKKASYIYQYASGEFAEIEFDGTAKKITIHDHHSNKIEMSADGTTVTDKNSNKIEMTTSGIKLTGKDGGELNLSGGKVALGKGDEILDLTSQACDKAKSLATKDSTHLHPSAMGPTGPPTTKLDFELLASDFATIKGKIDAIKGIL